MEAVGVPGEMMATHAGSGTRRGIQNMSTRRLIQSPVWDAGTVFYDSQEKYSPLVVFHNASTHIALMGNGLGPPRAETEKPFMSL